ncbi:MAG: hypothetical protein AAFP69_22775, partial [Planctomycetota bacterium]
DTTDVIIGYSWWPELMRQIKRRRPKVGVHVRTINAEALQHLIRDPQPWTRPIAKLRTYYGAIRLARRDRQCAQIADAVLGISPWDDQHYWKRIAPRRYTHLPYFSPWPHLQIAADANDAAQRRHWSQRHNRLVCMPGGGDSISQQQRRLFADVATVAATIDSCSEIEFQMTRGVHRRDEDEIPQDLPYERIDCEDPWDLLLQSRAVGIFTDMGYGFKTTIADGIAAGCHVIVHRGLIPRVPESLHDALIEIDPGNKHSIESALQRIVTPPRNDGVHERLKRAAERVLGEVTGGR